MSGRCSGQCCEHSTLGNPTSVKAWAERAEKTPEDELIGSMIIYRGFLVNPTNGDTQPWYWWTCKHFSRDASGLGHCGIYDTRPQMCRQYPGNKRGDPCAYKDCTFEMPFDVTLGSLRSKWWSRPEVAARLRVVTKESHADTP